MLVVGGGRGVKHPPNVSGLKNSQTFPAHIDSPVADRKFLRHVMGCGEMAFLWAAPNRLCVCLQSDPWSSSEGQPCPQKHAGGWEGGRWGRCVTIPAEVGLKGG